MSWSDNIKRFKEVIHKFTSKDTALFLFFLVVAAAFWMMLTFNNQMTHDVAVTLKIKKPGNVTLLQELPESFTVTVKDRGTAFLKSYFHSAPSVEIDFSKFYDEKSHSMIISSSQLLSELRRTFRREATILKISPEAINVKCTSLAGKKVPINWEDNVKNITTDRQFVINPDGVRTYPDSVTVFALDRATLREITEVDISTVEVENLSASLDKQVRIKPITNVRVVPSKVKLHVPVEPLIKKEQEVSISVRNQPYGLNVLLFPPSVNVSYLVPQSKYMSPLNLTVVVDYNDIDLSSNKVNIKLGEVSGAYSNVMIGLDSVNYVIERF